MNLNTPEQPKNKNVVSLRTERYKKGNSYVLAKVLTTLKRKSTGYDILGEEIQHEIDGMLLIENLHTIEDGNYELKYSGLPEDWETGNLESDGYILIALGEG